MSRLNFKKRRDKVSKSDILFIVLIIVLVVLTRAVFGVYEKEKTSSDILEQKKNEYEELKEQKENLSREIDKLNTERGVEEEIREKFGLIKEGEEIIVLVDNPSTSTDNLKNNDRNIFQKIIDFLGF